MVGIKGAQVMVAVNNDPRAPVFEQVDYGIVADCRAFLPMLIEKIKTYAAQRAACHPGVMPPEQEPGHNLTNDLA
jgi:hypothetical protein